MAPPSHTRRDVSGLGALSAWATKARAKSRAQESFIVRELVDATYSLRSFLSEPMLNAGEKKHEKLDADRQEQSKR